jgi:hypothetical protein
MFRKAASPSRHPVVLTIPRRTAKFGFSSSVSVNALPCIELGRVAKLVTVINGISHFFVEWRGIVVVDAKETGSKQLRLSHHSVAKGYDLLGRWEMARHSLKFFLYETAIQHQHHFIGHKKTLHYARREAYLDHGRNERVELRQMV